MSAIAARGQLSLYLPEVSFSLPESRRDRDDHVAKLVADVQFQFARGKTILDNSWLAKRLGVASESTVKRCLADAAACGIVEVSFDSAGNRHLTPLVHPEDLLTAGWKAFARVIVNRGTQLGWDKKIVRMAERVLATTRCCNWRVLDYLRRPSDHQGGSSQPDKCTPPAPLNAPPYSLSRERSKETTISKPPAKSKELEQLPQVDPVVVSLLTQEVGEPLTQTLVADREVQRKGGFTQQAIKHILGIFRAQKAAGKIQNPGGWLRQALRNHASYEASIAPPSHPSEVRPDQNVKPAKIRAVVPERPALASIEERVSTAVDPAQRRILERFAAAQAAGRDRGNSEGTAPRSEVKTP